MKNINLRSNFNVFALSKADAKVVYHEIYEMNAYGKHGITVQDGDVIIDAGANIGLFSINLVERYKNLQIYLFEPVGSIFECLEKNMAHYAGSNHVFLHHFGLSDQPAQTEFEFCPALSMAAGMYGADISQHYAKTPHCLTGSKPYCRISNAPVSCPKNSVISSSAHSKSPSSRY